MPRNFFSILILIIFGCEVVNNPQSMEDLYLGKTPPGSHPVRFAEDIIDNNFYPHSKLIISPSGSRIYWTTFIDTISSDKVLYYSSFDGENLSIPEEEIELTEYEILSFTFLNEDNKIIFGSLLPYDELNGDLVRAVWTSEKTDSGWTQPDPILETLDTNWASLGSVSINNAGDIYFSGRMEGETAKIYCSKFINGGYLIFEALPEIINTGITLDPFIDFNDEFLLFSAANRDDNIGIIDLYISYKDDNGNWMQPTNFGEQICTPYIDRFPMVTNDSKYLFFVTSHSDHFPSTHTHYYWVDMQSLEH